MSIIQETVYASGGTTPAIQNSLRFRASASAYLNRTFGTPTNNKKWTWSGWVKRSTPGALHYLMHARDGGNSVSWELFFQTDNALYARNYNGSGYNILMTTTQVFRDPAAWIHIVFSLDNASTGQKLYINGVQVTAFSTNTQDTANGSSVFNTNAYAHGQFGGATGGAHYDGVAAQVCFVDGQVLTPSAFGATDSTSGEWKPKTNAQIRTAVGTWGANGFLLDFTNTASTTTLGYDHSSSDTATGGNNFTCNNISLTPGVTYDALIDSPNNGSSATQPVANYATMNPLALCTLSYPSTYSEANLKVTTGATAHSRGALATLAPSTGKFYAEATIAGAGGICRMGVLATNDPTASGYTSASEWSPFSIAGTVGYFSNGTRRVAGVDTGSWGATFTTNDVIGVAFDCDSGKVWFSKNGSWQASGDPANGTNPAATLTTAVSYFVTCQGDSGSIYTFNFGQRPFAATPPSGFKAICSANLGTPAIDKPSTNFMVDTYTGNGGTTTRNSFSFSPDFVWVKSRSNAYSHVLVDRLRGDSKVLRTEGTTAETDWSAYNSLNLVSNGYSVGYNAGVAETNNNASTFVSFLWKGNGAGSSNTSGSITSTVSVNTTAGISIGTYTGTAANATVGHGLGVAPKLVICKRRNAAGDAWPVWHTAFAGTEYIFLNTTGAKGSEVTIWNSTAPSSTVFSIGTDSRANSSGGTQWFVAFAEIPGFSRFGSYTGNANADGTFIYTGFRPRWVMVKETASGGAGLDWFIYNTATDTYNVAVNELEANLNVTENQYGAQIDILSNGFKMRSSGVSTNSGTYIYAAFAESPLQYANAR